MEAKSSVGEAVSSVQSETTGEEAAKARIHAMIDRMVAEKTEKRIGLVTAKRIFDSVITEIFKAAVQDETFRFPGGHGSLHVRHLGVGTKPKRLPSGQMTEASMKEGRVKLRYQEGVEVKKLLGTDKKKDSGFPVPV